MKLSDRAVELAVTSAVGAVIAVGAAAGFSSPRQKFEEHEKRIVSVEARQTTVEMRQGEQDKTLARMDQKLDDLLDGLGVQRRRPR